MAGKTKNCKHEIATRLPSKLYERLMPFQKEGVEFAVRKNGRCLIADEMGLGKTLQAISVAYYYRSEWPLLIIVPSSLRYSWIEEFEKWLPDVDPAAINLIQTGSDASGIATAQVTITTFGLLSKSTSNIVREALLSQGFQVTIVDESHYIRNVKTASAKIVVPLIKNANRRILLSGTPALARPVELFPQIDAICPNGFGTWWSYTTRYCDARIEWIGKIKKRSVNGASNLQELQQKLSDKLMIRRQKNEVLTQLPPKQRQRVLFELKDSEIKKEIRQTFEELRPLLKQGKTKTEAMEVLTGAASDPDVKDLNSLSLIQKLYQLSGEAKIGPAKEYIEMLCDNPNLKFLVFAYHHSMMNGLSQSLYDKKIKFIRIDGDTPPSERPQLVHQFQSDPNTRVAILSILAAGVGLTFTAATVVVFAEMYWTPGMMVQCEDRAHRIGQTSCVAVHYLVAKDTMDEWVWSAVCKKTIVTSTTLSGKSQQLEADAGDKYQIDVLSNADVWIPKENENPDVSSFFSSQQPSDQKSILSFFSPSQSSSKRSLDSGSQSVATPGSSIQSQNSPSPKQANKRQKLNTESGKQMHSNGALLQNRGTEVNESEEIGTPLIKTNERMKDKFKPADKTIVVIDSGSDVEDFDTKYRKKKSMSKKKNPKSGKRNLKKDDKSRQDIRGLLSQSSLSQSSADPMVLSDSDNDMSNTDTISKSESKNTAPCPVDTDMAEANQAKSNEGSRARTNSAKLNSDCDLNTIVPNGKSSKQNGKPVCDNGHEKDGLSLDDTVPFDRPHDQEADPSLVTKTPCDRSCDQWSCSLCTFLNHKDMVVCEMCETPKKKVKSKAVIKQTLDKETSREKLQREADRKAAITTETSVEDKRNVTAAKHEPEVIVEFSMNGLKQNRSVRSESDSCKNTDTLKKKEKRYSNHLHVHDLSSSDEEPLENQIENYDSDSEGIVSNEDLISGKSNFMPIQKPRNESLGPESVLDTPKSRINKDSSDRECLDKKSEFSMNDSETTNSDLHVGLGSCAKVENNKSVYSDCVSPKPAIDCSSPKPGTSSGVNTPKKYTFKPFNTPKKYRFKSVDRSLGNSPLTPPPILNGCYSKDIHGSMVKETNYRQSPQSHDVTVKSDLENAKSDIRDIDNDKPGNMLNGFSGKTDKMTKASVGINNVKKVKGASNEVADSAEFSSPEMEELYAGADLEQMEQNNGAATERTNVRRQLDTGEIRDIVSYRTNGPLVADAADITASSSEKRVVNIDDIPVHASFHYQCSKYTGRIYVLTGEDEPLNINFIPMDIEVGNLDDLPDLLLHPSNLRLVQRFVREWQSLTETKRRLIIKHGRSFISPLREYDALKSCKTVNTQRHRTKEDTALAAMLKAAEVDGSVRVISRETGQVDDGTDKGVTQGREPRLQNYFFKMYGGTFVTDKKNKLTSDAVGPDGIPLCLNCFQPYQNALVQKSSVLKEENAWSTRFCSLKCSQDYWMKTNNDYCRDKVYEAERGICQLCGFDAHSLFKQVRDTHDLEKRADVIAKSKLNTLNPKTKQLMVKKPVAGQFWHVDHIIPVWEGGGQCDIDNLRTLCITCHHSVTAKQARKRAIVRKLGNGAGSRDITAFFQKN